MMVWPLFLQQNPSSEVNRASIWNRSCEKCKGLICLFWWFVCWVFFWFVGVCLGFLLFPSVRLQSGSSEVIRSKPAWPWFRSD